MLANRRALLDALATGGVPRRWVQPRHVHGTAVLVARDDTVTGRDGDGAVTDRRDLALVAIGADCAPIAIANDTACAAVHAGWRGAAAGVVEAGVAAVRELGAGPVRAVVGPCICASHYEFGADALAELAAALGDDVVGTTAAGAPAFDLRAAILVGFGRAGVDAVEVLDVCTVESVDHFSYRRDGTTGRHGVVVARAVTAIATRVDAVRARIVAAARAAGRDPASVRLVAATKTQPVDAVRAVLAAGVTDVGENRAQELLAKAPELPGASWHFIGRLQRNKINQLAPWVGCWHSVDRPELVDALAARATGARILVEVNVAGETQKGGCAPAETAALVDRARSGGLDPVGLMTVAPLVGDPRRVFAALRALALGLGLAELSMGMSGDFEDAIAEGATMIRVGAALFGPREVGGHGPPGRAFH